MILTHPEHAGRRIRLGYGLNLRECASVDELLELLSDVAAPVRQRLGLPGSLGVGLYAPAALARRLADPAGADELERLAREIEALGLDPFTWNAFPFGGFGAAGLKARVFEPDWSAGERLAFTLDVARVATALAVSLDGAAGARGRHVSLSTHTGGFGPALSGARELEVAAFQLARCVDGLASLEEATGVRVVLALEPEPGANAATQRALDQLLAFVRPRARSLLEAERNRAPERAAALVERHLGACLDACHAAVEGEAAEVAADLSAGRRAGPAKYQHSSALRVPSPAANPHALEALLALAEPRFLHQVRGHGAGELLAVDDLPDLARELAGPRRAAWLRAASWSCHFHVPVDLAAAGAALETTRDEAEALLAALAREPAGWSTPELHVEIETYTWEALPGWVRGTDPLVEGIERELRRVLAVLERQGWRAPDLAGR
ncbi:MAG: hypothetical protein JNK02_09455 [Planctomycetes bacterium]|nr:hypothetical protein [Planctomycetota bacterium]